MKDQILPEIPQQSMPHAQSMYQQLRKTSQKWFSTAGSHRRIFTTSTLSPRPSERGESGEGLQRGRVVELMREQIEIAVREYGGRVKGVLQEQARKIKLLGDLLLKNQMELDRKDKAIEKLVRIIEQRADQERSGGNLATINQKIHQNEQKLMDLMGMLQQAHQNEAGSKLKAIQRQYRQKLGRISEGYARKVGELSEQFEQRIDKVEKVMALSNLPPKSSIRCPKQPPLTQALQNLKGELEDLRQEVESFKRKKYKYENYKLEEVRLQMDTIRQQLQRHQQAQSARPSRSPNLKASATTHATRTDLHEPTPTSKSRFLNKYKSLISPRPLPHRPRKQSCSSSSSSHSDVEQTVLMAGQTTGNAGRLRNIITQAGLRVPLRIEIDQTGYAKSTDTGMYLVDTLGNGFEFTPQEISQLRREGLIAL